MNTPRQLPHKAWSYVAFGLSVLSRAWALPFVTLGWIAGVIAQGLALGWGVVFDDPLINWAVSLNEAHRRRDAPPRQHPCLADDDDLDTEDSEDTND